MHGLWSNYRYHRQLWFYHTHFVTRSPNPNGSKKRNIMSINDFTWLCNLCVFMLQLLDYPSIQGFFLFVLGSSAIHCLSSTFFSFHCARNFNCQKISGVPRFVPGRLGEKRERYLCAMPSPQSKYSVALIISKWLRMNSWKRIVYFATVYYCWCFHGHYSNASHNLQLWSCDSNKIVMTCSIAI